MLASLILQCIRSSAPSDEWRMADKTYLVCLNPRVNVLQRVAASRFESVASIWYLWTQRAGSRGGEAWDPGQLSGRHAPAGAEDTSLARGVTAHGRRGAQMTRSARNSVLARGAICHGSN